MQHTVPTPRNALSFNMVTLTGLFSRAITPPDVARCTVRARKGANSRASVHEPWTLGSAICVARPSRDRTGRRCPSDYQPLGGWTRSGSRGWEEMAMEPLRASIGRRFRSAVPPRTEPVRAAAANVEYVDCFDLGSGYRLSLIHISCNARSQPTNLRKSSRLKARTLPNLVIHLPLQPPLHHGPNLLSPNLVPFRKLAVHDLRKVRPSYLFCGIQYPRGGRIESLDPVPRPTVQRALRKRPHR